MTVNSRRMRSGRRAGVLRGPRGRRRDRQRQDRQAQQREMQARLPDETQPPREMRVGVAGEQRHLEEQQAAAPHRRSAAEPRQDEPGRHRLHEEQQKRAECDGEVKRHARKSIRRDISDASCGSCSLVIALVLSLVSDAAGPGPGAGPKRRRHHARRPAVAGVLHRRRPRLLQEGEERRARRGREALLARDAGRAARDADAVRLEHDRDERADLRRPVEEQPRRT